MLELVRRRPLLFAALAYFVLAAMATWPVVSRLGSVIGGDESDAIHSLWASWWWHDSLLRGPAPFSAAAVRYSSGALSWPRGFNLPAAILAWPMWRLSSAAPVPILHNAMLLATVASGGFSVLLLCRELWGGTWASFLAGALYAVSAYRTGLGIRHVELIALASSPLYLLGLVQTVRRHGLLPPVVAGIALAVSACSSRAHLVFCAMATLIVVLMMFRADRKRLLAAALIRRVVLGACVFVAAGGWYALGMLLDLGTIPPRRDLEGPLYVDLASFLVRGHQVPWEGHLQQAAGSTSTNATAYVGYIVLLLAAMAFVHVKAVRPWIVLAALGALLALGPRLHAGGRVVPWLQLPFGWVDRDGSLLRLAAPAEFTWMVVLGFSVAIGGALAALVRTRPRGQLMAAAIITAALVEIWPGANGAEPLPAPRFLRDLNKDGERWAVLDLTTPQRRQWNQMLHQHAVLDATLIGRLPRYGDARARLSALRSLEQVDVRFVITEGADASLAWLELPIAFEGGGLRVVELPAGAGRRLGSDPLSRQ